MRTGRTDSMSGTKIKKIKQLIPLINSIKKSGKKVVFTNGCFDILHFGHVMYLEKAKAQGDKLIVGLNSDSSIRRLKGNTRPIVKQLDRANVLAALESVDFVVIFNQDTPLELIKQIKPGVLVKGSDWQKQEIVGADFVESYGGKVKTIKLAKGRSTSALIKSIIEKNR